MGKYIENYRNADRRHRRLRQQIEDECRRSGHGEPITRRDFLSRGFISGMSMVHCFYDIRKSPVRG